MHDLYFTLSRIAAIIGFTMCRRGVCAAPRNAFFHIFHILYFLFSCILGSGTWQPSKLRRSYKLDYTLHSTTSLRYGYYSTVVDDYFRRQYGYIQNSRYYY